MMMSHAAHVGQLSRMTIVAALSVALAACAPALSNAPRPTASAAPADRVRTPPPVSVPPPSEAVTTAPLIVAPPPQPQAPGVPPAPDTAAAAASPPIASAPQAGPPAFSPPPPAPAVPGNVSGDASSPRSAAPDKSADASAASGLAIVLPLQSATFGSVSQAVEAGFSAAAELAGTKVNVIGHGDGEVLSAIDKARAAHAKVIAGPLLRDDLKALASVKDPLPWVIALNQLEDDALLPEHVYTLALSVEGEARQIARTMQAEGVRNVAIVASDSPLQRRFASSFTSEWLMQGGGPPASYAIVRTPDTLATLRQELVRAAPGAIVLAAEASDAALLKPYLPRAIVYASSQINDRKALEVMMSELDDIHFVEVPWLAQPDAPQFAGIPRRDWPSATLDRLYALGLDALQVALAFDHGAPDKLEVEGATGHLSLDAHHRIVREGRLVHLEGGRVVPDAAH